MFFRVRLDDLADVAEIGSVPDRLDAAPHALVSNFRKAARLNRRFADIKHAAGVAVKTVLDNRDVDVDDVARFEFLRSWYAMADDMIHRGADGFWVGLVAGRRVVQRRGYGVLQVHHVVMA